MGCGHSHAGQSFTQGVPVDARVWRLSHESDGAFPELTLLPQLVQRTSAIGVAIQGGGPRAGAMALGTLGVLHKMGHLLKVRYVVGVSGSAPVVGTFGFLPAEFSVDDYFGSIPTGPAACTKNILENPTEGSYIKVFSDQSVNTEGLLASICRAELCDCTCGYNTACNPCGCCNPKLQESAEAQLQVTPILRGFGLDVPASVMAPPLETDAYKRAVAAVQHVGVMAMPMRSDTPYPIISGSRLIIPDGKNSLWTILEASPLYWGTPVELNDAPNGPVGGGVIESFGINSPAPTVLPSEGQDGDTNSGSESDRVEVSNGEVVNVIPDAFMPLSRAITMSVSDVYDHDVVGVVPAPYWKEALEGGPVMKVWSPLDIKSDNNGTISLGDGGPTDPCGLLALLRRKVPKVVVQCCDGVDIKGVSLEDIGNLTWWASYWGRVKSGSLSGYGMTEEEMNDQCQVFDSARFEPLIKDLQQKADTGLPVVTEVTLDVLENKRCGVPGGWQVHMLWCFPSLTDDFKAGLQDNSFAKEIVNEHNFPFVTSPWDSATIRLLAENTAFSFGHGFPKNVLDTFFLLTC